MFAANQQQLGLAFLTCPRCTASLPAACCSAVRASRCVQQVRLAAYAPLVFFFRGCPTLEIYYNSITCTYHIFLLPLASCQLPDIDQAAPSRAHNTQQRENLLESLLCAWPACKLAYRARNLANRRRLHFASCCCGMRRRHRPIPIRIRIGIPSHSHATASDHCVGS